MVKYQDSTFVFSYQGKTKKKVYKPRVCSDLELKIMKKLTIENVPIRSKLWRRISECNNYPLQD